MESVFTVAGFGFNSNGQNTGLSFISLKISLKNWDKRPGTHNRVEAIAKHANGAFSKIKEGLVFPLNLPAIIELGTATGFDFELIDQGGGLGHQGGLGHEKLTAVRNQLLGMTAKHPNILVGVCPNGLEDTPQFKLIID